MTSFSPLSSTMIRLAAVALVLCLNACAGDRAFRNATSLYAQAEYEIFESRRQLQQVTGTSVDHFCYPWGENDTNVVDLVRAAGYSSAVTTKRGPAVPQSDPLLLPRISIDRGRGLFKFALHAATPYSWLRRH